MTNKWIGNSGIFVNFKGISREFAGPAAGNGKMHRIALQTILLVLLLAAISQAGWSEDMRLTDGYFEIHPQVIARNDTVHVVWFRLSLDDVSYMRSTDGGYTWGDLIVLSEPDHQALYADLSLSDNGLLVSWQDDGPNNEETIAIRTSLDGSVWDDPIYVFTDNMNHFIRPASHVKGDSIFLAYGSQRPDTSGEEPIRFYYSYDYGVSWSDEVSIGYAPLGDPQDLLVKYCNGNLIVVWAGFVDTVHSGYHVIGYSSTDAGQSWSDSVWISPNSPYSAQHPCIACNEETGQIAVGYMDYRYQEYAFHGDIFIAISDDGGLTWPLEVMATENHAAWDPSIDFLGDTLVAVWSDRQFNEEGQHEIMFNRSNDGGMSWEGEYRLTYAMGQSYSPWISMDSSELFTVWWENGRESGYEAEIYFKKYTPDPTGVSAEEPISPSRFKLAAYPNPFNSNLSITIQSENRGELSIYDILGRIITEIEYISGSSRIQWDATDESGRNISTGIYLISPKGGDLRDAQKVIYLR